MTTDHPQELTRKQWLTLPLKLRRRWWEETKCNIEPPSEELKQAIKEALDAVDAEQARLNRPDGWRVAHAAERARQAEEDNKIRIEACNPARAAHIDKLLARQLQQSIEHNGRMVEALRRIKSLNEAEARQIAIEALDEGSGCEGETE